MAKPAHILVIRLSALGDVAMTVPVLRVFSQTYPQVKLTVLSRAFFKPLFVGIPNLNFLSAEVAGKHKGLGIFKLAAEARALGIDAVADLHSVLRSKMLCGYFKLSGIKTAAIDKGRAEKKALVQNYGKAIKPLKSTHQRYADVFAELGFPLDLKSHVFPKKLRLKPRLNSLLGVEPKKIIGIAPFAAFEGKMYPLALMKEVIEKLDATRKFKILLFGGGGEESTLLRELAQPFSEVLSVAGKFSFEEELALISNLDLMLSMDSGNGHLAANYELPVLTLWGVTHPFAGFVPFNQPMENQLCADREKYPLIPTSIYGKSWPAGYENAISTISPDFIFEKIKSLLG